MNAGRKDLFTVLDMQHPAQPSDDAWMGNMLVDPARGKAHAAGPEERMGRKDLFDLMQQKILLQAQQGGQSRVRPVVSRGQIIRALTCHHLCCRVSVAVSQFS